MKKHMERRFFSAKGTTCSASGCPVGKGKHYQNAVLPQKAVLSGKTPVMNEKNAETAILHRHMAPGGKYGYLVVTKGALQFVWDDTGERLDADPAHPVVVQPNRYHHVELTGPVEFHVEFYAVR